MDFVAIDFETANYSRTSACSIGLVVVESGKIVQTLHKLIQPVPNYYVPAFIDIHGITPAQTNGQPTFEEHWAELQPYFQDRDLIAHNASFDFGVLGSTLQYFDIAKPLLNYYCSVVISRRVFPELPNHRLNTVSDYLQVQLIHHDAESDAIAAAKIVIEAGKRTKVKSIAELSKALKLKPKRM